MAARRGPAALPSAVPVTEPKRGIPGPGALSLTRRGMRSNSSLTGGRRGPGARKSPDGRGSILLINVRLVKPQGSVVPNTISVLAFP
jgi:hypothetical protein